MTQNLWHGSLTNLWWHVTFLCQKKDLIFNIFRTLFQPGRNSSSVWQGWLGNTLPENQQQSSVIFRNIRTTQPHYFTIFSVITTNYLNNVWNYTEIVTTVVVQTNSLISVIFKISFSLSKYNFHRYLLLITISLETLTNYLKFLPRCVHTTHSCLITLWTSQLNWIFQNTN